MLKKILLSVGLMMVIVCNVALLLYMSGMYRPAASKSDAAALFR